MSCAERWNLIVHPLKILRASDLRPYFCGEENTVYRPNGQNGMEKISFSKMNFFFTEIYPL